MTILEEISDLYLWIQDQISDEEHPIGEENTEDFAWDVNNRIADLEKITKERFERISSALEIIRKSLSIESIGRLLNEEEEQALRTIESEVEYDTGARSNSAPG